MAVTRRRRKAVARAVVIFFPVGPRDVCALSIPQSCASAASVFPNGIPRFLVDQEVKVERVGRRALQKMLSAQPRNLFIAKIRPRNRPALTVDQQIVSAPQSKILNVGHAFPATR